MINYLNYDLAMKKEEIITKDLEMDKNREEIKLLNKTREEEAILFNNSILSKDIKIKDLESNITPLHKQTSSIGENEEMIDNKFNELQNDIMRDMSVINNKYEQLILDKDNKIKKS